MLTVWLYTLVSLVAVSVLSFAGALLLGMNRRRLHWLTTYLVSLAIGALLGGAFLHLIPVSLETFEEGETVWLLVLAGFFISFLIEKMIGTHSHAHGHHELEQWSGDERRARPRPSRPLPMIGVILMGDAVHNFLDGVLIAGAFLLDPHVGLVTTLIVVLHELPQEFGDFGVLVSGGLSVKRALKWNFISALTAFVGALLALLIGGRIDAFAEVIVPLAAGNFIYIAAADLVPHLHEKEKGTATAGIIAVASLGVLFMLWIHDLRHILLH